MIREEIERHYVRVCGGCGSEIAAGAFCDDCKMKIGRGDKTPLDLNPFPKMDLRPFMTNTNEQRSGDVSHDPLVTLSRKVDSLRRRLRNLEEQEHDRSLPPCPACGSRERLTGRLYVYDKHLMLTYYVCLACDTAYAKDLALKAEPAPAPGSPHTPHTAPPPAP